MVLALGAPFAQMANTRWRSATLVIVFALVGTSSLLYGYADTAVGLILPQLLMGISSCAFYGNMLAVSFQLKGGANQGAVQGRITAFQGMGVFAGPLLGGWLLPWGATWAFLPGALCALIGAWAAAQLSPSQDMEERPGMVRYLLSSYGRWYRVITGRPTVQLGMVLVALSSFQFYLTGGVFYLVYASSLGIGAFWAAGLMSGRELLGGLVRFSFGIVAKRFGALMLYGVGYYPGCTGIGLPAAGTLVVGACRNCFGTGYYRCFCAAGAQSISRRIGSTAGTVLCHIVFSDGTLLHTNTDSTARRGAAGFSRL